MTLEIVPSGPGAGSELDDVVVFRLRGLGIKLSLDDLGRASSVAAIRMLQLDQVKIDAMFLHDAGRGGRADAIVRSLVELAHGLGLETVAEGVESRMAWMRQPCSAATSRRASTSGARCRRPSSPSGSRAAGPRSRSRPEPAPAYSTSAPRPAARGTTAQIGRSARAPGASTANAASPTPSIDA